LTYLKTVATDRLMLPSDPEYWVEMRQKVTYGAKLAAQQSMMGSVDLRSFDPGASNGAAVTALETAAYFARLLVAMVADWNLTDLDGNKLDVTEASIKLLEDEDGEFLQTEVRKRLAGRPKERELPLGKPSSQLARALELETPKRKRS
jgi:hypothetical protein